jgi:RNA polymerase sigma-70 factor (ECF subfamily)
MAITELAPRAAEMFTLRYLEELGNREIAALMGTSQAVVAVTLHNARSRLKKRLRELEWGKR